MRKVFLSVLIVIFVVFSVIFYGTKKNEKDNTVVFWTLQLGTFDKYINNIISDFEQENPEIKIKWIDVPYSEGEKRTLASILTDNPPDLVNLTPDFSLILAQKGTLYNINEADLSQYNKNIIEMLKYNGEYFGIPFYATSAVTLYNSSFSIKKIPYKYTDLFNIPFNENNAFITMINFCENDTFLKILNKYNINAPENINSKKSIALYNNFKDLYDKKLLPVESVTQTHRDALEKYMSGQLAFIVTGANFINMIKENAPKIYENTIVLPQLTGDTDLYDFSLMNFVIPKRAHNKEAALKFALYLTNEKNQIEFAKLTTILPVNKFALDDSYFKDKKIYSSDRISYFNNILSLDADIQTKARYISAEQLNYLQPPLSNIKNKKELNTLSANYMQQILINNKNTKSVLDEFSQNWSKL